MSEKPTHIKPSLYAYFFLELKEIAKTYGYNLVLHGSMNRDLDLIAIPWEEKLGDHTEMVNSFVGHLGGHILPQNTGLYSVGHHGRIWYAININRGKKTNYEDPQYYLDISIIPPAKTE